MIQQKRKLNIKIFQLLTNLLIKEEEKLIRENSGNFSNQGFVKEFCKNIFKSQGNFDPTKKGN